MKLQISQRDVYLILWHDIDFFFLSETDGTTGAGKASGKNLLEVSRNVCKKAINAMVVDIVQLKLKLISPQTAVSMVNNQYPRCVHSTQTCLFFNCLQLF